MNGPFLGAVANLRKLLVSFVMLSFCSSARKEELGLQWADFLEIFLRGFFPENLPRTCKFD
jgi:hypothetical protein